MYARRARIDYYSFAYTFPFLHTSRVLDLKQRDYRLIYDNVFSRLSFYLVDCKTFPIL